MEKQKEKITVWNPEFGERLRLVCQKIGSQRAAAKLIGRKDEMIGKYIKGESKVPLYAAATLCHEAGVSLDWLWFGNETTASELLPEVADDTTRWKSVMKHLLNSLSFKGARDLPISGDQFVELTTIFVDDLKKEGKVEVDDPLRQLGMFFQYVEKGAIPEPSKKPKEFETKYSSLMETPSGTMHDSQKNDKT